MHPELTIILVVGERRDRAVGALRSVLAQDAADRLEVLLMDLGPGDPPPISGSDHPAVRTVKLPPETLFSAAKAQAIRMASCAQTGPFNSQYAVPCANAVCACVLRSRAGGSRLHMAQRQRRGR